MRGFSKVKTDDTAGAVDDFTEAIKGHRKVGNTRTTLELLEERALSYREAETDEAKIAELSAKLAE